VREPASLQTDVRVQRETWSSFPPDDAVRPRAVLRITKKLRTLSRTCPLRRICRSSSFARRRIS